MSPTPRSMARRLAKYITDRSAIAAHLRREFNTQFTVKDIDRLLASGATESTPRDTRVVGEPISWSAPIRSNYGGQDQLAIATNAYLQRHDGKIRKALGL
jgi:hypothetical protein